MSVQKFTGSFSKEKGGCTSLVNSTVQSIMDMNVLAIYCYLMTKPDDWQINPKEIMNHFGSGKDKVYKALTALIEMKLLLREEFREKGKITHYSYTIFLKPYIENEVEPLPCFPEAVEPHAVNQHYTKQRDLQIKESIYAPYFKAWNNIAKDNPVLKDISHKRKKDYQQAEKAIKDLLSYWPELGIRSDLPMTPELFGNILHDVTQANWWFITKPDSIRTITMVLRQHNFEEALGILKLNTLRKKG